MIDGSADRLTAETHSTEPTDSPAQDREGQAACPEPHVPDRRLRGRRNPCRPCSPGRCIGEMLLPGRLQHIQRQTCFNNKERCWVWKSRGMAGLGAAGSETQQCRQRPKPPAFLQLSRSQRPHPGLVVLMRTGWLPGACHCMLLHSQPAGSEGNHFQKEREELPRSTHHSSPCISRPLQNPEPTRDVWAVTLKLAGPRGPGQRKEEEQVDARAAASSIHHEDTSAGLSSDSRTSVSHHLGSPCRDDRPPSRVPFPPAFSGPHSPCSDPRRGTRGPLRSPKDTASFSRV